MAGRRAPKRILVCRSCAARLAVPKAKAGRRIRCGYCKALVFVPRGLVAPDVNPLVERGAAGAQKAAEVYHAHLETDLPIGEQGLRRCGACHEDRFDYALPCACGSRTVGLDLGKGVSGRDAVEQDAVFNYQKAKRGLRRLGWAIWGVFALVALWHFAFRGILGALFWSAIYAVGCGALHAAVLFGGRVGITGFLGAKLPGPGAPSGEQRTLSRVFRDLIVPFLMRNDVGEREPAKAPAEDVRLLGKLLEEEGVGVTDMDALLCAATLRRDYELFSGRLERFEVSADKDALQVYALLYPGGTRDARDLPYLRQVRLDRGEDPDGERIGRLLAEHREQDKVDALRADLERRQAEGGGFDVSIEQIDLMDPFHFDELVGVIHQAVRGHDYVVTPPRGDHCDVILRLAGERTSVHAELARAPLGEADVQEAVAARGRYGCERAMVVTNTTFAPAARQLADKNRVELVDRDGLKELLAEFNKKPKAYVELALLLTPRKDHEVEVVVVQEAGEPS